MENSQKTKPTSTAAVSRFSRLGGENPTRVLIAVNVIPAIGVLFFGWNAFEVVFLFWMENMVIGCFAVLKMVTAHSREITIKDIVDLIPMGWFWSRISSHVDPSQMEAIKVSLPGTTKFLLVPFFCFHYGVFMFVHGALIVFLLGDGEAGFRAGGIPGTLTAAWHNWMWIGLAGLFFEHAREFSSEYLGTGKNRKTSAIFQMVAPYGRIVVMHVIIIAGGFFLVFFQLPRLMAIILVVAKTMMEITKNNRQTARDMETLTD